VSAVTNWHTRTAVACLVMGLLVAVAACGGRAAAGSGQGASAAPAAAGFGWFRAAAPPGAWHRLELSGQQAVLAYPPSLHRMASDPGAVTAGLSSAAGRVLVYLNATPRQGDETVRNWPGFRASHLREEGQAAVRIDAVSRPLRFTGGNGRCVMDDYRTKAHNNHYREIACFVQAARGASVIVAAAPSPMWGTYAGLLERAVSSYRAG
jgi:hypothetical protein